MVVTRALSRVASARRSAAAGFAEARRLDADREPRIANRAPVAEVVRKL